MEVTANSAGSVHVLRHSFWPSEHLAVALERYMSPGATRPRSLLYATRLVTLNSTIHPLYEINLDFDMVNRPFVNRHNERMQLGGKSANEHYVGARLLGNGALRVGMLPKDDAQFNSLISGFDELPNDAEIDREKPARYFLYADIPAVSLDKSAINQASALIESELKVEERARMYYVSPSAVDRRVIPLPAFLPETTRPE